jgi:hypothetical protein
MVCTTPSHPLDEPTDVPHRGTFTSFQDTGKVSCNAFWGLSGHSLKISGINRLLVVVNTRYLLLHCVRPCEASESEGTVRADGDERPRGPVRWRERDGAECEDGAVIVAVCGGAHGVAMLVPCLGRR